MTAQLPFPTNVRPSDPDTSHQAAAVDRTIIRRRVRDALYAAGADGLTDWELVSKLGADPIDKPSIGKRRQECDTVQTERTRPSPKDKPCVVWVLRQFATAAELDADARRRAA